MREFDEVQQAAEELQSYHSARNEMYDAMEEMYFMDSTNLETTVKNMKFEKKQLTVSPDPANKVMGAVRLLTAADPIFSIPRDQNDPDTNEMADQIEKFCSRMWAVAGKIGNSPIHFDVVLSGMIYGDVDIAVKSMTDLVELEGKRGTIYKERAKEVLKRTPYLFEARNPRECYPRWDALGLIEHLRRVSTTAGQVKGVYTHPELDNMKMNQTVVLDEYWDLEYHSVWIEGIGTPIMHELHGLPFIPIVASVVEGSSSLWQDVDRMLRPFLYNTWKSQLWQRQNLSMSAMYNMIMAIGYNPMFIYRSNTEGKEYQADYSTPGGVVNLGPGEEFTPMVKQVIDPSVMQGLDMARQGVEESTIYSQTLGQPLGGNAPFSMVALLHQAGRLPLVIPQKRLGWAMGKAMEIALNWLKTEGKRSVRYGGDSVELSPKDLPDLIEVEAKLEISLPQDNLQAANIAKMVTDPQHKLVTDAWALENLLNIGQPEQMQKEIFKEQTMQALFIEFIRDQVARMQQPPPEMGGGMPQMGMNPNQPPMGQPMPPEMQQGMAPPGMVGLPPEMAMGGAQGPDMMQGMGMPPGMPPEEMM